MILDLTILDRDVLNIIPLSLRSGKTKLDTDLLSPRLQHLLRDNFNEETENIFIPEDVFDLTPNSSIYNDFQTFVDKKNTIIEYIKNSLQININAFPFDPIFGSNLKKHLQTKDTSLRSILISSELNIIIDNINTSFDTNVQVVSAAVNPVETGGGIEYFLSIIIKIDQETVSFTIT